MNMSVSFLSLFFLSLPVNREVLNITILPVEMSHDSFPPPPLFVNLTLAQPPKALIRCQQDRNGAVLFLSKACRPEEATFTLLGYGASGVCRQNASAKRSWGRGIKRQRLHGWNVSTRDESSRQFFDKQTDVLLLQYSNRCYWMATKHRTPQVPHVNFPLVLSDRALLLKWQIQNRADFFK